MPSTELPIVLYIGGYSRSGSTMLDVLLGTHRDIASSGEMTFLWDEFKRPDRTCTCGKTYANCEVYGPWLKSRAPGEAQVLRRIEARSSLNRLKRGQISTDDAATYRTYARSLFAHIQNKTGARIIVDSSKSAAAAAGRALALRDIAGLDVRFLHLTRDPRATLQSYRRTGSNWAAEGLRTKGAFDQLRPVFGWTLANRIAAETHRAIGSDRAIHLRYEDLMMDPGLALTRVGQLVETDLSDIAHKINDGYAFEAGHNVGGNRTRLEPLVVRTGQPKRADLPAVWDIGLAAIAGTTARDLGYGQT